MADVDTGLLLNRLPQARWPPAASTALIRSSASGSACCPGQPCAPAWPPAGIVRHLRVARDIQHRDPVAARRDVHDHDRVSVVLSVVRPDVKPDLLPMTQMGSAARAVHRLAAAVPALPALARDVPAQPADACAAAYDSS